MNVQQIRCGEAVSSMIDKLAAPVRRTQAERRDESERGVLQAAIAVVANKGVGAVTFDAVGRQGGFSRGLATQRFGSKQGLIVATIDHLRQRQEDLHRENRIDDLPGLDAVLAYVDLYLRDLSTNEEGRAYFMLLSSAVADASELRIVFAAAHTQVERRLEAWVLRGQSEGAIRREIDADAAALMIGSLLFGLSMQMLIDPTMNLDPIRETSLMTLRLGFGADGSAGGAGRAQA
jgi:AcrR family transcriptional regulator